MLAVMTCLTVALPDPILRRDRESARALPHVPAVYAAWIDGEAPLADAGIAGDERALWYIGKASGKRGLRGRLQKHVSTPF